MLPDLGSFLNHDVQYDYLSDLLRAFLFDADEKAEWSCTAAIGFMPRMPDFGIFPESFAVQLCDWCLEQELLSLGVGLEAKPCNASYTGAKRCILGFENLLSQIFDI